ncbi:hypothetical protein H696_04161 [Fonticula alba]|uniref:Tubulin-tyrosine ligase n=1 Tax=Fonticula alba TaxID=691883 RepID=A0A058Z6K0_FONAL|nr:hypothetical protein H696_04161 [Fonticula alba]KCV69751.1 hypothetical protein H696_04161 [Fonticula alba]|eukprot:XP_009496316.1 hypothetical protein H696_04161 [Fonticula alba]
MSPPSGSTPSSEQGAEGHPPARFVMHCTPNTHTTYKRVISDYLSDLWSTASVPEQPLMNGGEIAAGFQEATLADAAVVWRFERPHLGPPTRQSAGRGPGVGGFANRFASLQFLANKTTMADYFTWCENIEIDLLLAAGRLSAGDLSTAERFSLSSRPLSVALQPTTFCLPRDAAALSRHLHYVTGPEDAESPGAPAAGSFSDAYIAKPPDGCGGAAITLLKAQRGTVDRDAGQEADETLLPPSIMSLAMWAGREKRRQLVVQRYLSNPRLVSGVKFDLRVYVLIAEVGSHDSGRQDFETRVWIYSDGLARFCTRLYEKPRIGDAPADEGTPNPVALHGYSDTVYVSVADDGPSLATHLSNSSRARQEVINCRSMANEGDDIATVLETNGLVDLHALESVNRALGAEEGILPIGTRALTPGCPKCPLLSLRPAGAAAKPAPRRAEPTRASGAPAAGGSPTSPGQAPGLITDQQWHSVQSLILRSLRRAGDYAIQNAMALHPTPDAPSQAPAGEGPATAAAAAAAAAAASDPWCWLTSLNSADGAGSKRRCYELLGFDIMFDENDHPWILEVNASPSLSIDLEGSDVDLPSSSAAAAGASSSTGARPKVDIPSSDVVVKLPLVTDLLSVLEYEIGRRPTTDRAPATPPHPGETVTCSCCGLTDLRVGGFSLFRV